MSKKSKTQSVEVQSSTSEDHTHSAPVDHTLTKAKGDVLDRFWASVEPYCADITETELNMLEEGMKSVRVRYKNETVQHKIMFMDYNNFALALRLI